MVAAAAAVVGFHPTAAALCATDASKIGLSTKISASIVVVTETARILIIENTSNRGARGSDTRVMPLNVIIRGKTKEPIICNSKTLDFR